MLELLLIILVIFCLFGGGYGWSRRADWGPAPSGVSLLLMIILIIILFRVL